VTEAGAPGANGHAGQSFANTAGDHAQVGAQYGFVAGDAHTEYTYYVGPDQSPADIFRVAVRFLKASAGPRAADLIRQAVSAGFTGTADISGSEVAYYWVLAILSGRAFHQLKVDDLHAIRDAGSLTDRASADSHQFLRGYDLMCELVACLRRLDEGGGPDPALGLIRADYKALLPERQEDFERHLEFMLESGLEEDEAAAVADRARARRMSNDRADRAWMFFEQVPQKPRPRTIESPTMPAGSWLLAGLGGCLAVAGLILAIATLWQSGVARCVLVSALLIAGGAIAAVCSISRIAARERLADKDREFGHHRFTRYSSPVPPTENSGLPDETDDDAEADRIDKLQQRRARFVRVASSELNDQFISRSPHAPAARRRWERETAALKESLKNEILTRYSEPELAEGSVNWLIRWRVDRIAQSWRDGSLRDYRKRLQPRLADDLGMWAGLTAAAAALISSLIVIGIRQPLPAVIVFVLLSIAGVLLAASRLDVHLVQLRRTPKDRQDAQAEHEAELAEWETWSANLELGRPSDAEMARWLDFDKLFLRRLVMSQLDLSSQDILSHATLTEPAAGCLMVRLPHGPPRCSRYLVTVILLTRAGVRMTAITLNTLTGEVYNQVRRSFRYEVIMTASVHETGVRYDSGSRQVIHQPDVWIASRTTVHAPPRPDLHQRTPYGALILRQDVRLSLGNRDLIQFRAENVEGLRGNALEDDEISLLNLALDTSGITAAIELLEDISGHGAQWVEERLQRRRRWAQSSPFMAPPVPDEGQADQA